MASAKPTRISLMEIQISIQVLRLVLRYPVNWFSISLRVVCKKDLFIYINECFSMFCFHTILIVVFMVNLLGFCDFIDVVYVWLFDVIICIRQRNITQRNNSLVKDFELYLYPVNFEIAMIDTKEVKQGNECLG